MKAVRWLAVLPIRVYQKLLSPMVGRTLPLLPLVLGIRGAGHIQDTAYSAGSCWPGGVCCAVIL